MTALRRAPAPFYHAQGPQLIWGLVPDRIADKPTSRQAAAAAVTSGHTAVVVHDRICAFGACEYHLLEPFLGGKIFLRAFGASEYHHHGCRPKCGQYSCWWSFTY